MNNWLVDKLKLYNTLTHTKENFIPFKNNIVKMFVCGPTVYDSVHLGHARTYLIYDVLARYLKFKGFKTLFIVNITDLDDKIFEKAKNEQISYKTLSEKHTKEFIKYLKLFNINSINHFPRVSKYLEEIESQIEQLIRNGHAYDVNGDIFFDVSTFSNYGRLSHQSQTELKLRRLNLDPKKRDQRDFPLWRSWMGKEPPYFTNRFGQGRPGWHIEDTAISMSELGSNYDIHGGAIELIFPHHEAEIAQAESITNNPPFVKYWVHAGLLLVNGEKMSKSLDNFVTLEDAIRNWSPNTLRLYFLSHHYRNDFNFKRNNVREFERKTYTIQKAIRLLDKHSKLGVNSNTFNSIIETEINKFFKALDNDLDTPKAIDSMLLLINEVISDPKLINNSVINTIQTMLTIIGFKISDFDVFNR